MQSGDTLLTRIRKIQSALGTTGLLFLSVAIFAILVSWVAFFFFPSPSLPARAIKTVVTLLYFTVIGLLIHFVVREHEMRCRLEQEIFESADREKKLRILNQFHILLHEATVGMLNRMERGDLLNSITRMVGEISGVPDCFLFLYDSDRDRMVRRFGSGIHAKLAIDVQSYGRGEAVVGTVWETGTTLLV